MIAFDPSVLAPYFSTRERRVTIPASGAFSICGSSPDRVYLAIANATGTVILVSTLGNLTATVGLPIAPNTILELSFQWHGSLTCQPWYGATAALGGTITVIEVLYTPSLSRHRHIIVPGEEYRREETGGTVQLHHDHHY